jgi:hypothetical protein
VDVALNVVLVLVSIAVGGYITFRVWKHYYGKAAEDLRGELMPLVYKADLILRGLEAGDVVEWNRDPDTGEIVGVLIHLQATIGETLSPIQQRATGHVSPPSEAGS